MNIEKVPDLFGSKYAILRLLMKRMDKTVDAQDSINLAAECLETAQILISEVSSGYFDTSGEHSGTPVFNVAAVKVRAAADYLEQAGQCLKRSVAE